MATGARGRQTSTGGGHQFLSKHTTVPSDQSTWSRLTGGHQGQCLRHLSTTYFAPRHPFPAPTLSSIVRIGTSSCTHRPAGRRGLGPDLPGGDTEAHRPRGKTDVP